VLIIVDEDRVQCKGRMPERRQAGADGRWQKCGYT
jgi:hypothetical protein